MPLTISPPATPPATALAAQAPAPPRHPGAAAAAASRPTWEVRPTQGPPLRWLEHRPRHHGFGDFPPLLLAGPVHRPPSQVRLRAPMSAVHFVTKVYTNRVICICIYIEIYIDIDTDIDKDIDIDIYIYVYTCKHKY